MQQFTDPIPLTLYIHLPWCVRKCPYCDFNSHALRGELPEAAYIDCLLMDLEQDLPKIWGRRLSAIFIGGGTPSLFSGASIERLLRGIQRVLPFSVDLEITLEANPGTVEQERFIEFRQAGINRLSLGIQSFDDTALKSLGRIHSSAQAKQAIQVARLAQFTNINLDLMFGLPSQTIDQGIADLTTALEYQPNHMSWYQLTLEPNTLFYQRPPKLPDDEVLWQMQLQGQQYLADHDFKQYEVSAYCREAHRCAHNVNYWTFGDYLGIGAGAHSKITDVSTNTVMRLYKYKHPKDYLNLQKDFIAETKTIDKENLIFEFMLNALRLYQPISFQLFTQRTGLQADCIKTTLQNAAEKGLLTITDQKFFLTPLGRRFLNDVVALF